MKSLKIFTSIFTLVSVLGLISCKEKSDRMTYYWDYRTDEELQDGITMHEFGGEFAYYEIDPSKVNCFEVKTTRIPKYVLHRGGDRNGRKYIQMEVYDPETKATGILTLRLEDWNMYDTEQSDLKNGKYVPYDDGQ